MHSEVEYGARHELDDIAVGIEAKLDPAFSQSRLITQRTVETARQVGFSEATIQRWEAERQKHIEKGNKAINKSIL